MLQRISILLGLLFLLAMSYVQAQEIRSTGIGIDRDSALRDAQRAAVEQVVGAYVDSSTLVENGMVELDEIYARADGFTRIVKIESEGKAEDGYRVIALIDVDTNPNTELMSRMQMLTRLNDPRMAVIVLQDGKYNVHEKRAESIIMERLVDLGFSHVVDVGIVSALNDARMLESLYRGQPIGSIGQSFGVDLVIIGSSRSMVGPGKIPDFKGGYKNIALHTGNMELVMKIVRPSTGDIIASFSVDGKGIGVNAELAQGQMTKKVANDAAKKIEECLRRLSMQVSGSIQIVAMSGSYDKVNTLVQELKKTAGVQKVVLREHNGNRAIIEVETNQKTATVIQLLQKRSTLPFFVESLTDSRAEVALP